MYVTIRNYQLEPKSIDEVVRRAKEDFVPLISQAPGFLGYYVIDGGHGALTTVSVFETSAGADASTKQAASWVKQNLATLVPNPPTITAGEVKVHRTPAPKAIAR